jgi:hypothetical protein
MLGRYTTSPAPTVENSMRRRVCPNVGPGGLEAAAAENC